jgi:cell division protease FtsH
MIQSIKQQLFQEGRALGMVMNLPERDKHGYSIKYLKARMAGVFWR